ncbi:MAG: hypothetical protein ACE5FN_12185 [Leptospirillia bacterium]
MQEMTMGAAEPEPDQPPASYWEADLEVSRGQILEDASQDGYLSEWIGKLPGRPIGMLCRILGIEAGGSVQRKKDALRERYDELLPYLLVDKFAFRKSKVAATDVAEQVLSDEVLDLCRKGEDEYDITALLFAVFHHRWQDLRTVFHLDKIHKAGFARMSLNGAGKLPSKALGDYLKPEVLQGVLKAFDHDQGPGRRSELRDIIVRDDRHIVFVRRGERPGLIMQDRDVVHGFSMEWVVLDFDDDARHVNISSHSVSESLEIANRIASGYFGIACEYDNQIEVTYEKQLEILLSQLIEEQVDDLSFVEIVVADSQLEGSSKMRLSNAASVCQSVRHFGKAVGDLLTTIAQIESIKVGYSGKRVSLLFEPNDTAGEYVVRYSDHRLNGLERRSFEAYMKRTHGITILSTEKRHKR